MAILGPTASGKSTVAESAAQQFGAEIVSVDSMQVYRGMDVGTAKPSVATQQRIPHHLIDVTEPECEFSVRAFQELGRSVIGDIERSHTRVIIAGGSGLHFRSLVDPMTFAPTDAVIKAELEGLSLEELQQTLLAIDSGAPDALDFRNPRRLARAIEIWRITTRTPTERAASPESLAIREYRPEIEHISFGMDAGDRSADRIEVRFDAMLAAGFIDEVRTLSPRLGRTASQAVGYKELLGVVKNTVREETARLDAIRATTGLVKRQRTYFRRDPRIEWIPWKMMSVTEWTRPSDALGR